MVASMDLSNIEYLLLSLVRSVALFALQMSPWAGLAIGAGAFGSFATAKGDEKSASQQFWLVVLAGGLILGPVAWFGMPALLEWIFQQPVARWPDWHLQAQAVGFAVGMGVLWGWYRYALPAFDGMFSRKTKRSGIERNRRTDVREIDSALPAERKPYDPSKFFKKGKIFIGRGESGPVYVDRVQWRKSHVHVIGTTGAGKGVASGVLLSQALADGEATIVLDPKEDEWAPHVLRAAAQRAGVPFYYIDLRKNQPQIDLLAGLTGEELEELLIAGFELADSGESADFYRVADREAAALTGQLLDDANGRYHSLTEMYENESLHWLADRPDKLKFDDLDYEQRKRMALGANGFVSRFKELLRVPAIDAPGGLDLGAAIEQGACIYIVGSLRLARVRIAQKMLFLRLLQIVERRDRMQSQRSVCLFLDEFRYHLSRPSLDGLATARDKGLHVIMAHQSIGDLDDVPGDLSPEAVKGAVVENAALRIAYRVRDPETADWLGRMSGSILVDDEVRRFERNAALAETVSGDRSVRQAERHFFDLNSLLNLPDSWAAVYGAGKPQFAQICPMNVKKEAIAPYSAPKKTGDSGETDTDTPNEPTPTPDNGGEGTQKAGNPAPRFNLELKDNEPDF